VRLFCHWRDAVPALTTVKAALRQYALTFEGTTEDHPWGETAMKVRGKVFVFFGVDDDTSDGVMGVKLARSLLYARSLPHVEAMGYGLGKSGWCNVKRPKGRLDLPLMKEWIAESYQLVAPKRLAARATSAPGGAGSRRTR
jgi:predicted DNA-binding protein (MmcQ/YjbR family)